MRTATVYNFLLEANIMHPFFMAAGGDQAAAADFTA